MKSLYSLAIIAFCLGSAAGLCAQPLVQQQDIVLTHTDLRLFEPLVLQSVIFTQHPAGTAVVRFDGVCYADSGDIMVMAASRNTGWTANDGNVSIQVANAASKCRSFSHSRIYALSAGTDTFYALGQNYSATGGSGMASVYGSLTVEFFPASVPAVHSTNLNWSGNMAAGMVPMDSISIPAAPAGKAYVHMDGQIYSDPGDRIMLAANYKPEWTVDEGSVAVMAATAAQRFSPYAHSFIRDISANPNTFYAVSENVVDQGRSGSGSVYGSLSAEFFPNGAPYTIDSRSIVFYTLPLRSGPVALDSITVNAPHAGKVLLQFDGYVSSTTGDMITLAASDTRHWTVDAGNTDVKAASGNDPYNVFSHSRLYSVSPGSHTFYCVAENYVDQGGKGMADILGNFSAKYYPDAGVGVTEVAAGGGFSMYPNPAQNNLIILFPMLIDEQRTVDVLDLAGRTLISIEAANSAGRMQIDISGLPAGMYLVRCGDHVEKLVKD